MESGGFDREGKMARKVILEIKEGNLTRTLRIFFADLLKGRNLDALLNELIYSICYFLSSGP